MRSLCSCWRIPESGRTPPTRPTGPSSARGMTGRSPLWTWPVRTRTGWWASLATTAALHTPDTMCQTCTASDATGGSTTNDRRVSCVEEADVLGEGHQRNGYIFYLHKDLCSQVASVKAAEPECNG